MNLDTVPLTRIALHDTTYRITLRKPDEPLRNSLRRMGILHPPLLKVSAEGGPHQIICGFRRVACASELGWERIPVLLLNPSEAGPKECLLRNYGENRLQRELHICEKAQWIDKLQQIARVSTEEVLKEYLPELQLAANLSTLDRLQRMNRWPPLVKEAACEADLASPPLLRLADRDEEDAALVIGLFARFRWSYSRQKEVLGYLWDLASHRRVALKWVVKETLALAEGLDPCMPLPQKAEALRRHLRNLRFPRLTQAEDEYHRLREAFRFGPQIAFHEPPDFEGDEYRVEFHFRNRQEYQEAVAQLQSAAACPEFDALFDLL